MPIPRLRLPRLLPDRELALAFVAASLVLFPIAFARLIDGDEGYYLQAARLISEGSRPYVHFFHPQTPFLGYAFGAWFRVTGPGWYAGRALGGLIGALDGALVFHLVRQRTGRSAAGAVALALFLSTGAVLGWFAIVKAFALTALCLLLGCAALERPSGPRAFLAGALFLLAAATRLYAAVALPCAAIHLLRRPGGGAQLVRLMAGGLAAALPFLPVVLADPRAFWFDTVSYHALRAPGQTSLIGEPTQKWDALLSVLSLKAPDGPGSVQLLALIVVAVGAAGASRAARGSLCFHLWVTLGAVSLLPTPALPQYFSLLAPFLIIEAAPLIAELARGSHRALLAAAALAFLALGAADLHRFTVSGRDVPGIMRPERAARWSLATVREVERLIDRQGATLAGSWWPGYFVGTRVHIAPGLENDFGFVVAPRLDAPTRRRYHVMTDGEVEDLLRHREVPLFVSGNWARPVDEILGASGYAVSGNVANVVLWRAEPR